MRVTYQIESDVLRLCTADLDLDDGADQLAVFPEDVLKNVLRSCLEFTWSFPVAEGLQCWDAHCEGAKGESSASSHVLPANGHDEDSLFSSGAAHSGAHDATMD